MQLLWSTKGTFQNGDMELNENIIPIAYYPGTGGHFLCHFLVNAKHKKQLHVRLSETNHSHYGLKDLPLDSDFKGHSDEHIINAVNKVIPFLYAKKPYFFPAHITSAKLINENFKRSIKIVYELDDIKEIATIYYKKFYLSSENTDKSKSLDHFINLAERSNCYNKKENNYPNILFLSWKEYFKGNTENFVEKLSLYTGIQKENFFVDSLLYWRKKTYECLE